MPSAASRTSLRGSFPTSLCPFPGVSIAAADAQSARILLESGRLCPIASASGGGRNPELPTLGGDVGRRGRSALERRILDVVLGRVRVRKVVHDVETLVVRVV